MQQDFYRRFPFFFQSRSKIQRERDRDISEQIALGMPSTSSKGELQFDQRLFNQNKGMDSGFGEDDSYNVYDKPWRSDKDIGSSIYRPSKNVDKDVYGDDLDKLMKGSNRLDMCLEVWFVWNEMNEIIIPKLAFLNCNASICFGLQNQN